MAKATALNKIVDQVKIAAVKKTPVYLKGHHSKRLLSQEQLDHAIDFSQYAGVIDYEPSELVATFRAGTTLQDIEDTLAEEGQMLASDPLCIDYQGTIGGAVASGWSGARRAYTQSTRDSVLGIKLINGKGETLQFGGKVIKNVAGFDVSRLVCGSFGVLGALLDITLKVMPKPEHEITLCREGSLSDYLECGDQLIKNQRPVSASYYDGKSIYIRLSGYEASLDKAALELGWETVDDGDAVWRALRALDQPFFRDSRQLWRISCPAHAPMPDFTHTSLLEWHGGLRWLDTIATPEQVFLWARSIKGNATLIKSADVSVPIQFMPLNKLQREVHKRVKAAFDPNDIFSPDHPFAHW